MAWITYLLLAAVLLVVARWLTPRRMTVRQDGTRLVLSSPLLARLLEDLRLVTWGALSAFFLALFAISREWLPVGLFALILLRIGWLVYRNVTRGTLIVDPAQDAIQLGPRVIGRVSELVALQVSRRESTSVVLVLRDGARQDRGVLVRGADRADGPTISGALAEFLHVPVMESSEG
jgi:hypothetical protein